VLNAILGSEAACGDVANPSICRMETFDDIVVEVLRLSGEKISKTTARDCHKFFKNYCYVGCIMPA